MNNSTMRRNDFPILQDGAVAYLDNAATSQKPAAVLEAMEQFYRTTNANVHRGLYHWSETATAHYEQARDTVQQFINAQHREEIIFTSGTTAAINTIAYALGKLVLQPGDVILLSQVEHHSNLVPWQLVAEQYRAKLEFFDPTQPLNQLPPKTKLVSLAHIANSSGLILPIQSVIALAHQAGVPVVVDAAQSVPHMPIDVQQLDCDFLAFSAHKLCGPTGVGVLYGKRVWLEKMSPVFGGGDMIRTVTLQHSTYADLPHKFEAGTPNIAGVIGLGAAVQYLTSIGMTKIQEATSAVHSYLVAQLKTLDFITLYGPEERSSIVSFNVRGVHAHDVAAVLDQHGVAVRAGHHCAMPVMEQWGVPATVRASVYFYNDESDIDKLIVGLKHAYGSLSRPNS
ncbi:MAG: SufS family cysteine desulfurase [Candidatus Kerfeldbacteria bacterium]|nr:SufS family cysteine desulfurase [Candidatus Kerfeldbacteria bacterium]